MSIFPVGKHSELLVTREHYYTTCKCLLLNVLPNAVIYMMVLRNIFSSATAAVYLP